MNEIKVSLVDENKRLDAYLAEKNTEISRSKIKKLIEKGNILVNNKKVKGRYLVKENDILSIELPKTEINILPEDIYLDIIYEDEYLAIINKQDNLTVHPTKDIQTNTLVNGLLYKFEKLSDIDAPFRYGIVHRLDKDTTGLLIIAKDNKTHKLLQDMFKNKEIEKRYMTIVHGKIETAGTINANIGRNPNNRILRTVIDDGKESITHYNPIDFNDEYSLLDINLETGRTHQIRVHMKYINHNIVGDKFYGLKKESIKASRQMLHAYRLKFIHPITLKEIDIKKYPSGEFLEVLKKTNLNIKDSTI